MAGEVEAFGQMATAGMAASTLDGPRVAAARGARRPVAEPRDPHDLAHGACANCETVLTGAFCATCGQSAHVHRSIGHIFEEFLHGIWHFDSKAWRTLPKLVFRPGTLTRNYVYGQRARYIAPLAMFLFSVFLMFFVFETLGGPDVNKALNAAGGERSGRRAEHARRRPRRASARRRTTWPRPRPTPTPPPAEIATLTATLATKEAALAKAQQALTAVQAARPVPPTRRAAAGRTSCPTACAPAS